MGEQGHPTIQDDPLAHVTPEYLTKRGIGGGDIASILGLHPYRGPHDCWLQKMGLGEPFAETEAAQWGVRFEPIILDVYAERIGQKVIRATGDARFKRDPVKRWRTGSIDAVVDGQPVGVDAKMTNPREFHRWGDDGTDEVPDEVGLQAQWYLDLWQFERWDIAALLGNKLSIYSIRPNPAIQSMMLEVAEDFWTRFILTKTIPPVDWRPAARKAIEKLHPMDLGEVRQATPEESAMVFEYMQVTSQLKAMEQAKYQLTHKLCERIGDDAGIQLPDFGKITWRRTKDSHRTDWESVARAIWNDYALLLEATKASSPAPEEPWEPFGTIERRFTKTQPGGRRFLPQLKGGES